MAFCGNCGHQLVDDAKFCKECGTPVANNEGFDLTERRTVYAGEIHKCPNCGEVISSFTAICPACGFELSEKQTPTSLQIFIDKIKECDKRIANDPQNKTGWSSWNSSKRFGWVLLNICFVCLPLAIYLVSQSLLMKKTPKLTNEEKGMASLVENFLFPNDRESIIAGLVFAKEKIHFISSQTINRKRVYWMRLWRTKAEQLKQKADMLFPGDAIVSLNYSEILKAENRVNKIIQTKYAISWIAIGIVVVFCLVSYSPADKSFEWKAEGLYAQLPEPNTTVGEIIVDTNQELNFELHGVTKSGFEKYVSDCIGLGFSNNSQKTDSTFLGTDEDGFALTITYYKETEVMNVTVSSFNN